MSDVRSLNFSLGYVFILLDARTLWADANYRIAKGKHCFLRISFRFCIEYRHTIPNSQKVTDAAGWSFSSTAEFVALLEHCSTYSVL
jgi:hypothetical protein